ncbi:hypothetical protein BDV3_002862 [Batrachochytrium dendrobatidis]
MSDKDICNALKGLQSVDDLKHALEQLQSLRSSHGSSELNGQIIQETTSAPTMNKRLLSILLKSSVVQWALCLTTAERESLYDTCFFCRGEQSDRIVNSDDLVHSMEALFQAIRCSSSPAVRRLLSATLAHFLKVYSVTSLLIHVQSDTTITNTATVRWLQVRRVLSTIPELPDINDSQLDSSRYCTRIGNQLIEAFESLCLSDSASDWTTESIATLVGDLINRGHADAITHAFARALMSSNRNMLAYKNLYKLCEYMSRNQQNTYLLHFLEHVQQLNLDFDTSLIFLQTICGTGASLGRFACWAVQQQKLAMEMMDIVLWSVFCNSGKTEIGLVLSALSTIWSSRDFIVNGDYEFQKNMFITLVLACHYCRADMIHESEPIKIIFHAVSTYLELANSKTRTLGLRLAEILSTRLYPEIALHLDIPPSDDLKALESCIHLENLGQGLPLLFSKQKPTDESEMDNAARPVFQINETEPAPFDNPDSTASIPVVSLLTRSLFDDDSSDSEDDNQGDEAPESKQLDQVPTIKENRQGTKGFLADYLAALKSKDDPDRFEECLLALAKMLITISTLELEENHETVCSVLVSIEDRFDTDGFDVYRVNAWTAMSLRFPKKTAEFAARVLFDKQYTMFTKFWILQSWNTLILGGHTLMRDTGAIPSSTAVIFQLALKLYGDVTPTYLLSQTCMSALFAHLQFQRNWQQLFTRDEYYMFACEVLKTCRLLMLSTVGSPYRVELFEELGYFLNAFEREERRLMFIKPISDLTRIYEAGAV